MDFHFAITITQTKYIDRKSNTLVLNSCHWILISFEQRLHEKRTNSKLFPVSDPVWVLENTVGLLGLYDIPILALFHFLVRQIEKKKLFNYINQQRLYCKQIDSTVPNERELSVGTNKKWRKELYNEIKKKNPNLTSWHIKHENYREMIYVCERYLSDA